MALSFSMVLSGIEDLSLKTLRSRLQCEEGIQILEGKKNKSISSSSDSSSGFSSLGGKISSISSKSSHSSKPTEGKSLVAAVNKITKAKKRTKSMPRLPTFGLHSMIIFFERLLFPPVWVKSVVGSERVVLRAINSEKTDLPESPKLKSKPESEPEPEPEPESESEAGPELKIMHGGRDILNLAGNLGTSGWQIKNPEIPLESYDFFMSHPSIFNRLGDKTLTDDYPVKNCASCGFDEPSLYFFSEFGCSN